MAEHVMSERQYKQFLSVLNKEEKKNEILVELPSEPTNYYQVHDGMVHKDEQGEYTRLYIKPTGTLPYPFEENAAAIVKVQNHEDGTTTYTVTAHDDGVDQIAKAATIEEIDPNPYEAETKSAFFYKDPAGKEWADRFDKLSEKEIQDIKDNLKNSEPIEEANPFSGEMEKIGDLYPINPNNLFPLLGNKENIRPIPPIGEKEKARR